MAINYPGPLELRFFIVTDGLTHEHRLNADPFAEPDPGEDIADIDLKERGGLIVDADTAVDAWVVLLKATLATVSTITRVDLWKYAEGTFDATFITSKDLNVAGTVGPTYQPARQDTLTFRTFAGGTMRVTVNESAMNKAFGKYAPSGGDAAIDGLLAFILSTDNWLLARDNAYPVAGISYLVGQNEKIFRQRYR
jgi:hypothetical protein